MTTPVKPPILGHLRLAWQQAIAATNEARRQIEDEDYSEGRGYRGAVRLGQAQEAEIIAARAYLSQLVAVDPFCSVCGCTQLDGCLPRCFWISSNPWICSTHQGG